MEREVFGSRYGSEISKQDFRSAVGGLELEKARSQRREEKEAIDKKIRYLRELGGKNL